MFPVWYEYSIEYITDNSVIYRNYLINSGRPVREDYILPLNLSKEHLNCLEELFGGNSLRIAIKNKIGKKEINGYINSLIFEESIEKMLLFEYPKYSVKTQSFLFEYYFNLYKFYLYLDIIDKEYIKSFLDYSIRI